MKKDCRPDRATISRQKCTPACAIFQKVWTLRAPGNPVLDMSFRPRKKRISSRLTATTTRSVCPAQSISSAIGKTLTGFSILTRGSRALLVSTDHLFSVVSMA